MDSSIASFVKTHRRMFVRELEQGKQTLRIDKINQVLALFGHEVGAVPINNK